jgi:F-type H+-transporting ATPase subunit gamma
MPNLKSLAIRIKSTTSTAKITKAMKMVAASKLRGAEAKMLASRPFVASIQGVLSDLLTPKEDFVSESKTVMAITSDKGMCGGVNSKIVKEIKLMYNEKEPSSESNTLLLLGGKARDGLARTHPHHINVSMDEAYQGPITFSLASFLGEQLLSTASDSYSILYNKFKSVIVFDVVSLDIKGPECLGESGVLDEFEFEGEKEEILANMYQFNVACSLYGCLLENYTSEQASRMTAMDSATNNANEMISKLTIQYNRQRQAVITTELTEIVAGAESV